MVLSYKKWISNTVLIIFPLILTIFASQSFATQRTESQLDQTPKNEKITSKERDLARGEVLYKQAKELLHYPISGREPLADKKFKHAIYWRSLIGLVIKKQLGHLVFR
ncbi:hypothetical protein [Bartonella sp. HY038]|uniref:hypothetical protein n=1 Tax=Bartonella sp. HY038 TaxID=2759660 RepID=UPI0015FA57FA|nr:hypothetical protein [Bartonella sp. HY038]